MNKRRFLQALLGLTATSLFEGAQGRAPDPPYDKRAVSQVAT